MVSEVMLQQTQVPRVIEKYKQFLEVFPDVNQLAEASLHEVLFVWQGLGYNRRGRFLREAAKQIVGLPGGVFPRRIDDLVKLPGIGTNTAAAILAYAYNQPVVFIETNIRTVYLHHFFQNRPDVSDKEILGLVDATLERDRPREFYWALMDYGTFIKKEFGNPNVRSRHYTKQSVFQGSNRQIRGMILRELTKGPRSAGELQTAIADKRVTTVLTALTTDKLVRKRGKTYSIAR